MRAGRPFAVLLLLLLSGVAQARIITREEAMQAAFPGAQIRQSMIFLTENEMKAALQLAGVPVTSALIARYDAEKDGKPVGCAYLDTHIVRTKKESLLLILNTQGKILRVEVVAFLEPPEYMPPDRWYRQFDGQSLNNDLQVGRTIHPVTGATLSGRATAEAVRRTLAIDSVLRMRTGKKP